MKQVGTRYCNHRPPPPPLQLTHEEHINRLKQQLGFHSDQINQDHSYKMECERHLQYKVVEYIRRFHPDLRINDFGQDQDSPLRRSNRAQSGYTNGCCDIIVLNPNAKTKQKGLSIELKNPRGTGNMQDNQFEWLAEQASDGHDVLISNDYDHIVDYIKTYAQGVRFQCDYCTRLFKSKRTKALHMQLFHQTKVSQLLALMDTSTEI